MDAMGMGLCVAFIAFVRLPSLKVSTLLLSGLLLYDVFWVFFSQYVFSANVMVKVRRKERLRLQTISADEIPTHFSTYENEILEIGNSFSLKLPRLP